MRIDRDPFLKKEGGEMVPHPAAWMASGAVPLVPCLSSQTMQSTDVRASPSATRHEPRRRRGSLEARLALQSRLRPRPRPLPTAAVVTGRGGGGSNSAGRLSSRGLLPPLAAPSPRAKSSTSSRRSSSSSSGSSGSSSSSSSSSSRIAANRGDQEEEEKKRGGGLLSRWAQLTAREKSVVAAFVALAILFGPRLLLLSLVSLEAAATGALLAAERALGAAFLTSFSALAGVAVLLLAGLFVYFLILEEERLEDSSSDEE